MEEVLDKMRELKFNRENDFIEKAQENKKVTNVKYLGVIEYNGEPKQIYLLLEQEEKEDGTTIDIERYYTEDGEFLGGNNKSDQYDFIILAKEHQDDEKLLKSLQDLDKDGELDLNKLEDERLEEIALALGISKEEIRKMSEIDVDKKIDKEEADIKKVEEPAEQQEKEIISKKSLEKISTKTEIRTNQKVTDNDTMASLLNIEDKGYKKVAIINSDSFKDSGNTTRFSIVGIKEDGSAERIDTLEQGYGRTPTKSINSLNRDGTEIEQEQVNSIFKIKGQKEKQIAVKIGAMGTIETNLVRTPAQDNQEAISIPIETANIKPTTRETRELMNERRNPRVKEEIQRIKEHQELDCDPQIKDIDDNEHNDTHTHTHIKIDEQYLNECANKILENDNVANVYNKEDVKARLKNYFENSNDEMENTDEIIQKVEEQMEHDAENEHEMPGHNR